MRILVMLLAACGGASSVPPANHPPSPAPARSYAARVGVYGESWTDIVIDGTDAAAHELCDAVLAMDLRLTRVAVTNPYTRPCALETLAPPAVTEPYLLVDSVPLTQDSVAMELMMQHREPLRPAHGTRTTRVPLADRATCEAMKKHLDADDAASHDALVTATAEVLAQQLAQTTQREQDACGRLRDDEQRCANLPPDAATACLHAFDDERRECGDARAQREVVERKRHAPPPAAPTVMRACEPAR